jgi:D-arabinose 1-dehydrogenase-like Zn-dependent alcohol dehydrogenase
LLCTISTVGNPEEVAKMVSLLDRRGKFYPLSMPDELSLQIPSFSVLMKGLTVQGSLVGSNVEIKEMLEFAAKTGVRPWVEKFSLKDPKAAIEHMEKGRPRYRIVMEA